MIMTIQGEKISLSDSAKNDIFRLGAAALTVEMGTARRSRHKGSGEVHFSVVDF
jgi:hypothetical protein